MTTAYCYGARTALTSNQRNWTVFLTAMVLTLAGSAVYLNTSGVNDDNIRLSLRLTANLAFVVFLLAFIARPLRQLVTTPLTIAWLKNRRLIGIAFAGIHTAHLALIFYRAEEVPDFDFTITDNLLGAFTYLMIYLMFFTSFNATARAVGPKSWQMLHKVGLYWIFIVFAQTLLPESSDDLSDVNWWLLGATAVALVVRLTAFLAKRR